MITYISGHLKISNEEFAMHYLGKINQALASGESFVVGDARGADTMAQEYLSHHLKGEDRKRVTIYHMFDKPRNNVGNFQTKGGYKTDEERDAAMTAASESDIAWVRPGRETSGTAKNILRRTQ
jgi:hypothetical protein